MQAKEFLQAVVTTEEGFFCLALAQAGGSAFTETWYLWPRDTDKIVTAIESHQEYNIYFSPYLFTAQSRARENVLPSRTIVVDLDDAPLDQLPLPVTVLLSTSEGRHQGYWLMEEAAEPSIHESLSRRLTYAIEKADRASWPIGHTARMPFSKNYKYGVQPDITIVKYDLANVYGQDTVELLPDDKLPGTDDDLAWVNGGMEIPSIGPQAFLQQLKQDKRLPPKVIIEYNVTQSDRSSTLWALMNACFRAGLTRDEVFHLAWHSKNNKWADVRYHGKRELAKDVLRAERVVRRRMPDPRASIAQLRITTGHSFEKHAQIARIVYDHMLTEGDFIHTDDNMIYYVKRDIGRPVELGKVSEYLAALLDLQFGLNASEVDTHYVTNHLLAKAITLPADTDVGVLSTYNAKTDSILVHTGRRDVLRITKGDTIERFANGTHGVLFPWSVGNDPFEPDFAPLPNGETWWDALFGDGFKYVQDMAEEDAMALMRVWTLFIIMRRMVSTRPILAYFGPPGSGKSTIMKCIYRFLYGKNTQLLQLTTAEKFDLSTVKNAFVCIDNADTWTQWLPDRMALSISDVQTEQRKLWTNGDIWLQRRQAVLAVTAHNPKFGREDISSRLLLLTFRLIPDDNKRDESAILSKILAKRNKLWGAVLRDVQAVMQTSPVQEDEVPPFRIADFATLGMRIARAQGVEEPFVRALHAIRSEQKLFTLEEENSIVTAMMALVQRESKNGADSAWRSSGQLFNTLALYSGSAQTWERTYHDARAFSKKMQAMQEALSRLFTIETKVDTSSGVKLWRILPRDESVLDPYALDRLHDRERNNNGTIQGTSHLVKG